MSYEFRPAKREQVSLLIGVAGASGSGKTFSALRLASGLCNGKGMAVIDTEAGRALHYADQFKFDHCDMRPPFRPDAYRAAIEAADDKGYDVIVIDSVSHEWAGEGGILDWQDEEMTRMGGDDYRKREAVKMAAWIKPKMSHKRMMSRLLQCRAHLIFCLRAEEKMLMSSEVDEQTGRKKTIIVPAQDRPVNERWQPICEKNFMYEMTASFLLLPTQPGIPVPLKLQEQHKPAVPEGKPLDENCGKMFREWAGGGEAPRRQESDPLAMAEAEARKGTDHFRSWWNSAEAKAMRAAIKPHLHHLQTVAQQADQAEADEDPFGDTETQEPQEQAGMGSAGDAGTLSSDGADAATPPEPETPQGSGQPSGGERVGPAATESPAATLEDLPHLTVKPQRKEWEAWCEVAMANIRKMTPAQITEFQKKNEARLHALSKHEDLYTDLDTLMNDRMAL